MIPLWRMLVITVLSDMTTVTVMRGTPFLAKNQLDYTSLQNLGLTLAFGASYVVAALLSHRTAHRLGERRTLSGLYLLEMVAGGTMFVLWRTPGLLYVYMGLLGCSNGAKWPVVESLVTAGRGAAAQAKAIGRFNIAWSATFPVALLIAGPIIRYSPGALFLIPATLNVVILIAVGTLPSRPMHLPEGHPDLLAVERVVQWGRLLTASRWLHLLSIGSLAVFGAIMPTICKDRLHLPVQWATGMSGLTDLMRFLCFIALANTTRWHGRRSPLVTAAMSLTAGFFLVATGPSLGVVIAGQVLLGLGIATSYYCSLYYGMALANAAVSAGGVHEALIGMGNGLGPALALGGLALLPANGGPMWGVLAGMSPAFAACFAGAAAAMLRLRGAGSARPCDSRDARVR